MAQWAHRTEPRNQSADRTRARARTQSGQAVVEAALILPAMIFLLLCCLQVTLLQQARLMVEYAAFNAARAGIVHNMNNGVRSPVGAVDGPMRDAAVLSILPTWGTTTSVGALTTSKTAYEVQDLAMRAQGVPMVQVAVLNPTQLMFDNLGQHLNRQEIDFDDQRPAAQAATLLSIQVRYLYELRVPFANKMVQAIWLASTVGVLNSWRGWDLTSPSVGTQTGPSGVGTAIGIATGRGSVPDGMPGGLNIGALARLSNQNRFYLPVNAWYTMRMQSNPFRQWAP